MNYWQRYCSTKCKTAAYGLRLYQKQKDVLVKFLFLRYPDDPERECPHFSEEQLVGFEHYLEYIKLYTKILS